MVKGSVPSSSPAGPRRLQANGSKRVWQVGLHWGHRMVIGGRLLSFCPAVSWRLRQCTQHHHSSAQPIHKHIIHSTYIFVSNSSPPDQMQLLRHCHLHRASICACKANYSFTSTCCKHLNSLSSSAAAPPDYVQLLRHCHFHRAPTKVGLALQQQRQQRTAHKQGPQACSNNANSSSALAQRQHLMLCMYQTSNADDIRHVTCA
jgi:hypothetical protein